jgi:hypothetical protein
MSANSKIEWTDDFVVVSALCADLIEPPACAMLRRGKQARRYNLGPKSGISTECLGAFSKMM